MIVVVGSLFLAACTASQSKPPAVGELAHAVVQIVAVVDGEAYSGGSGTIVSPDGLVLTNAHVIQPDDVIVDWLEVGMTEAADLPPTFEYRAEVLAADAALDLAVVRIAKRLDGGDLPSSFPFVTVGDSDALEIGAGLRILGYPGIGGETITLTSGQVSGFVSEAGLGHRAWIKTDATIAGGNSGGLAADDEGRLVAIPSIVGASTETDIVDCRSVADTNRDRVIDEQDECVPIGGFLNGLRPVGLAKPMLEALMAGLPYEPIVALTVPDRNVPAPSEDPGDSLAEIVWGDPVFAADVTDDDRPVGEASWLPADSPYVCAFWEYEGMQQGTPWSAIWSVDGTLGVQLFTPPRWAYAPRAKG